MCRSVKQINKANTILVKTTYKVNEYIGEKQIKRFYKTNYHQNEKTKHQNGKI